MHTCRENIARDGWHATGVLAGPGKPGYIYTTGLTVTYRHPELVITGLPPEAAHGVLCAAVGVAASRPFLDRVRQRLDAAAAAVGLPLIGEGSALLLAVLSVVAPPVGPVVLLLLLWMLIRGRGRDDQKYAGLRILR